MQTQVAHSEQDAEGQARQQRELKASKRQMDASLVKLRAHVDDIKASLKLESQEASVSMPANPAHFASANHFVKHGLPRRRNQQTRYLL